MWLIVRIRGSGINWTIYRLKKSMVWNLLVRIYLTDWPILIINKIKIELKDH